MTVTYKVIHSFCPYSFSRDPSPWNLDFWIRYLLINSCHSCRHVELLFSLGIEEHYWEDLFTAGRYQSWLLKCKQVWQGKVAQHPLNNHQPSLDPLLATLISLQLLHAVGSENLKTTLKNKLKLFKQFSLPCYFHVFLNCMKYTNLKASTPTKAFLKWFYMQLWQRYKLRSWIILYIEQDWFRQLLFINAPFCFALTMQNLRGGFFWKQASVNHNWIKTKNIHPPVPPPTNVSCRSQLGSFPILLAELPGKETHKQTLSHLSKRSILDVLFVKQPQVIFRVLLYLFR